MSADLRTGPAMAQPGIQWWVIGPCPYEWGAHRAVSLADAWAERDQVFYVYGANVLFWLRSVIGGPKAHPLPPGWGRWARVSERLQQTSRIAVDLPPMSKAVPVPDWCWMSGPPGGRAVLEAVVSSAEWRFGRWLRREIAAHRRPETRQVVVNFSWNLASAVRPAPAVPLVYDCSDNFSCYPGESPARIDWYEKRAVVASDVVVVSSACFEQRVGVHGTPVHHVPNGVSLSLWDAVGPTADQRPSVPPVVVYHGLTYPWRFDWPLVAGVAARCPDLEFRIHTSGAHAPADVRLPDNVRCLEWVRGDLLVTALRQARLGFMPYVLAEPTLSGFPLKLFEYFAAGLPVVSTPLREVLRFSDVVELCDGGVEPTVAAVRRALDTDSSSARADRRALAARFTWTALADDYRRLVFQQLAAGDARSRACATTFPGAQGEAG